MIKLGVNWEFFYPAGQYDGFSVYKRGIAAIKQLGFDGLMISGYSERFVRSKLMEIKDVINSEGLTVFQVHLSSAPNLGHLEPTERLEGVECHKRWIHYALELGAQTLNVHPGGWRHLFDEKERKVVRDRNLGALKEIVKEVRKTNLKIALENVPISVIMDENPGHGYGFHIEELSELVDNLGRKNVGICLDMGHAFGAGLDIREAILATKGYLIMTHLTDYRDIYEIQHLLPGQGNIDWRVVANTLCEIKYRGPWVLEVSPWDKKRNRMATEWRQKVKLLEGARDFLRDLSEEVKNSNP